MDLRRRTLVAALGLAPLAGFAQARRPTAGVDYFELDPRRPIEVEGKIDVIEFFWYGCPACYRIEPALEKWVAKLPADVHFRRVPAVFNEPKWQRDAALFYTFEALGVLERLHRPLFDAIHRDRVDMADAASRNEWLQRQGVDVKRFEDALKSFGVQTKLRRAAQLTAAYRIEGTPALAVDGRYMIGAHSEMIGIADYLINVARKAGAAKG